MMLKLTAVAAAVASMLTASGAVSIRSVDESQRSVGPEDLLIPSDDNSNNLSQPAPPQALCDASSGPDPLVWANTPNRVVWRADLTNADRTCAMFEQFMDYPDDGKAWAIRQCCTLYPGRVPHAAAEFCGDEYEITPENVGTEVWPDGRTCAMVSDFMDYPDDGQAWAKGKCCSVRPGIVPAAAAAFCGPEHELLVENLGTEVWPDGRTCGGFDHYGYLSYPKGGRDYARSRCCTLRPDVSSVVPVVLQLDAKVDQLDTKLGGLDTKMDQLRELLLERLVPVR